MQQSSTACCLNCHLPPLLFLSSSLSLAPSVSPSIKFAAEKQTEHECTKCIILLSSLSLSPSVARMDSLRGEEMMMMIIIIFTTHKNAQHESESEEVAGIREGVERVRLS